MCASNHAPLTALRNSSAWAFLVGLTMTHSVVWLNHVGGHGCKDSRSANKGVEEGDSLGELRGCKTICHVVANTASCRRNWVVGSSIPLFRYYFGCLWLRICIRTGSSVYQFRFLGQFSMERLLGFAPVSDGAFSRVCTSIGWSVF